MNHSEKRSHHKRKSLFRKWHRRIGFSAAIFVINMAVTGIILNHSDDFELHNHYVTSKWILDAYGIIPPTKFTCTKINTNQICSVGNHLYWKSKLLIESNEKLIGAVGLDDVVYLATTRKIHLYTRDFDLIETLDANNGLDKQLSNIGISLNKKKLIIQDLNKQKLYYVPDDNSWEATIEQARFSAVFNLTNGDDFLKLQSSYLKQRVSYLKFFQDLHSLRPLKSFGKYLTDLIGVILIFLVISGFIAWQRRTKRESI